VTRLRQPTYRLPHQHPFSSTATRSPHNAPPIHSLTPSSVPIQSSNSRSSNAARILRPLRSILPLRTLHQRPVPRAQLPAQRPSHREPRQGQTQGIYFRRTILVSATEYGIIDARGVNLPPLMFDGRESAKPYVTLEGHTPLSPFPCHERLFRYYSLYPSSVTCDSCFICCAEGNVLAIPHYVHASLMGYNLMAVASPEGLTRPPFHEAIQLPFRECTKGESFGPSWSTHWFRITLRIPHEFLEKVRSPSPGNP
jgi:hypothetical protein